MASALNQGREGRPSFESQCSRDSYRGSAKEWRRSSSSLKPSESSEPLNLAAEEKDPIELVAHGVCNFTFPQELLSYRPNDADVRTIFKNGDSERKIYCNIPLTETEAALLKQLNKLMREADSFKLPSNLVGLKLRALSHTRGNSAKALECIRGIVAWRASYFASPIVDTEVDKDLQRGFVYLAGRDQGLRPLIVLNVERAPRDWKMERLVRLLVFQMEYMAKFMFLPGVVETCVVLLDLSKVGIFGLPKQMLMDIVSTLSKQYMGRLYRLYVVNASSSLANSYGLVKPFLSDRQQAKIFFVKNSEKLLENFARHQLERRYGGTRENLTSFYPFRFPAGPFHASCKDGPRKDAVADVHRALAPRTTNGALWEGANATPPKRWWSCEAPDVFARCGLPPPPRENCAVPEGGWPAAEAEVHEVDEVEEQRGEDTRDMEPATVNSLQETCQDTKEHVASEQAKHERQSSRQYPEIEETCQDTKEHVASEQAKHERQSSRQYPEIEAESAPATSCRWACWNYKC